MTTQQLSHEQNFLLTQKLFPFLQNSPTPYHAVKNVREILLANHFCELHEKDSWEKNLKGRFFLAKEGTLIAFTIGEKKELTSSGIRIIGAHTDSPCLKVRPNAEQKNNSFLQLGVEVYGGANLGSWFDRDLSLAGKLYFETTQGELDSALIDFKRPIAIVPNLAIHLDREINDKRSINKQTELPPILGTIHHLGTATFDDILKAELKAHGINHCQKILGHDLRFYDSMPPQLVGLAQDFISGARLDNLLSCFVALESMLKANSSEPQLIALFDHEEVGSDSETGAGGSLLRRVLQRLTGTTDAYAQTLSRSLLVSLDNAHSVHPNYASAHDPEHRPVMNGGAVIKINANQRYATSAATEAYFSWLCEKGGEPYQKITVRADKPCGSTIGPITTTSLSIPAVDIGLPTLAMHSIRELAGSRDLFYLTKTLSYFLQQEKMP